MELTKHIDTFWTCAAGDVRLKDELVGDDGHVLVPDETHEYVAELLAAHPKADFYRAKLVTVNETGDPLDTDTIGILVDVDEWVHPTEDPTGLVPLVYVYVFGDGQGWQVAEHPGGPWCHNMEDALPCLLDRYTAYLTKERVI